MNFIVRVRRQTDIYRGEQNRDEGSLKLIVNISVSLRTVGKSLENNAVSMQTVFLSLLHNVGLNKILSLIYGIIQSFMCISEYSMCLSHKILITI